MGRTAVVAGATGLVGSHLVDALLEDAAYDRVQVLARRATGRAHAKLRERVVQFSALDAEADVPEGADAFCCLGTTIRKAGSQDAFRLVDYAHVLAFAQACRARGARSFHVVSAMGASPRSRVFYNRVKGEMERDVARLGLASVTAYRPSLLLGHREESRPAERAGVLFARLTAPLWVGPMRRWKAIPAATVARAMVAGARAPAPGFRVRTSDELWAMAESAGGG